MSRIKAKGKRTNGAKKPAKTLREFSRELCNREDVVELLHAYHEKTVVPLVVEYTAPWWRKAWWYFLELRDEFVKRWHAVRARRKAREAPAPAPVPEPRPVLGLVKEGD